MARKRPAPDNDNLEEPGVGRGRGRGRSSGPVRPSAARSSARLGGRAAPSGHANEAHYDGSFSGLGGGFALPPQGLHPNPTTSPSTSGSGPSVNSTVAGARQGSDSAASGSAPSGSTGSGSLESNHGREHQKTKLEEKDNPADRFPIEVYGPSIWHVPEPDFDLKMRDSSDVMGEISAVMKCDFRGPWYTWKYLEEQVALCKTNQISNWISGVQNRFRWPTHQHEQALQIVRHRLRLTLPQLIGQYKASVKKGKGKPHPPWTTLPNWNKMKDLMENDARYAHASMVNQQNRLAHGPVATHSTGRLLHQYALEDLATQLDRAPTVQEDLARRYGTGEQDATQLTPDVPLVVVGMLQPAVDTLAKVIAERCNNDPNHPDYPHNVKEAVALLKKPTNKDRVRFMPNVKPADMGLGGRVPRRNAGIRIEEPDQRALALELAALKEAHTAEVAALKAAHNAQQRKMDELALHNYRLGKLFDITFTPDQSAPTEATGAGSGAVGSVPPPIDEVTARRDEVYLDTVQAIRASLRSYELERAGRFPSGVGESSGEAGGSRHGSATLDEDGRDGVADEDDQPIVGPSVWLGRK